jgi:hypothetical protein
MQMKVAAQSNNTLFRRRRRSIAPREKKESSSSNSRVCSLTKVPATSSFLGSDAEKDDQSVNQQSLPPQLLKPHPAR